jgi:hypothetical protein
MSVSSLRVVAGSLATLLLGAFVASAQTPSLAEVARREEERRKTTKPATKVLTNKDLPAVASPGTATPNQAQAPAPAEAPKTDANTSGPDKTGKTANQDQEKGKDKDEAWWKAWWAARIAEPRNALRRDEVLLDALQARINALTSDFTGRDDPAQRSRIGEDRQKALAEMERIKTEITDLKKQIEDIEEEARRAGVPPGWVR